MTRFSSDTSQQRNLSMFGRLTQTFPVLVAFNRKYVLRFKLTARATCGATKTQAHAGIAQVSFLYIRSKKSCYSSHCGTTTSDPNKSNFRIDHQKHIQHANIWHLHRLCIFVLPFRVQLHALRVGWSSLAQR